MTISTDARTYPANSLIIIRSDRREEYRIEWVTYNVDTDLSSTFDEYDDANEWIADMIEWEADSLMDAINNSDLNDEEKEDAKEKIEELLHSAYYRAYCGCADAISSRG